MSVRRLTFFSILLFCLSLLLLAGAFRFWGERSWVLTLAVFAPIWFWALPALVLAPMAWMWHRRMLWVLLGALLFLALGPGDWRWRPKGGSTPQGGGQWLTVMTYNTGEGSEDEFRVFSQRMQPDVLLLQDVTLQRRMVERVLMEYPHRVREREFMVISRWPVRITDVIYPPEGGHWRRPVGVRGEVETPEGIVAFYSLHLPTMRPEIYRLWQGKGTLEERVAVFKRVVEERLALYRRVGEVISVDPEAGFVAGDFNAPSWGYLSTLITPGYRDAFLDAGSGFGRTFPGTDPYLPSFLGLWLRLDYVRYRKGDWELVGYERAPGRESQHMALVARFIRRPGGPGSRGR